MTFRETWETLTDALAYSFITGGFIPIEESKMTTELKPKDGEISERERHERDCRLSCLAHAIDVNRIEPDSSKIIERAKEYYDFVEKGKVTICIHQHTNI